MKLDSENQLQKPRGIYDVGSSVDRETSTDSMSSERREHGAFGHRMLSLRSLQEPRSEGYLIVSGLSASASSSLVRTGLRPLMGSSHAGVSGFGVFFEGWNLHKAEIAGEYGIKHKSRFMPE